MKIAVIGVNHDTAPIHIREKLSFTDSQKIEVLNQLLDYKIKEAVVVSTCNRSEIYIHAENIELAVEYVQTLYEDFCGVQGVIDFLFRKQDEEAALHLYRVAAGLDSIVIGEDQILGQVKDAHEFAMEIGTSGKILNKLFREAVTTAKQIKSEMKISEYPLSISYIGVKFLTQQIGTLQGKTALLIGAGKMNQLALNHLYEEGIETVYLANRTSQKARELAQKYERLEAVDYEQRYGIMQKVDLVITSTASPHLVVKKSQFLKRDKMLYILDIALPRDVEESLGNDDLVTLYDIDDLKQISNQNNETRKALGLQAEGVIVEAVETFVNWLKTIKIDPTIHSLHGRCQEISEDTMHYIKRKTNLSCKEEKIVEKMIMSSLKRLIREPINNLKEINNKEKQEEYIKLIEELFEL